MKQLLIYLFFILFSFVAQAQENRLLLIENNHHGNNISYEHSKRLGERLKSVFAASSEGITTQSISIFAVRPYLEVSEFGKAEGIKTKITCNANLRLTITNLITGASFGEENYAFQGIGDDKNTAINQAINAVKATNPGLKKFVIQTQANITSYYAKECVNILVQAQQQLTLNNFTEAAIMAGAVPSSAPCYQDAQALKQKSLLSFQQNNCKNILIKADAAVAANDFKNGLQLLSQIDAASPCTEDVKTRLAAIETKVDEKNKEDFDWFFKAYSTGAELQKAQIKVYEEILMSYFRTVKGMNVY